jgi:thymidylate synthase ThyX
VKINVLDHGYVELIEAWGHGKDGQYENDDLVHDYEAGIIEAARQSTQGNFRGWDQDAKLLKHLHDNKHATPFEFAGMVLEVQAPIFVFREWHRHRTQCLSGDTNIALVSPRGTTFKRSIREIFDLKYGGVRDAGPKRHKNGYSKAGTPVTRSARLTDAWRKRVLPNCQNRVLRTLDESTGIFGSAPMRDVWEAGVKEIWAVETERGIVRASAKHPFLTRSGWANVEDISVGERIATGGLIAAQERPIPPALRQGIGVWTSMMRKRLIGETDACHLCGDTFAFDDLELDHVVPVVQNLKLALDEENLKPACRPCHRKKITAEQAMRQSKTAWGVRWLPIRGKPIRVAEEMTYDLEMTGPDHNYLANGLVVHNSYNEMSARYTPLPDLYYTPERDNVLERANAAVKNRQAQGLKAGLLDSEADVWLQRVGNFYRIAEAHYQEALNSGIPKELARLVMPVGHYSRMRASANLRNWLAFLTLRMDSNAQWEIRQYANAVGQIVERYFPQTWKLFNHD